MFESPLSDVPTILTQCFSQFLYHRWQIARLETWVALGISLPHQQTLTLRSRKYPRCSPCSSFFRLLPHAIPTLWSDSISSVLLHSSSHHHWLSFWNSQLILPQATLAWNIRRPFLYVCQGECLSSLLHRAWGSLSGLSIWASQLLPSAHPCVHREHQITASHCAWDLCKPTWLPTLGLDIHLCGHSLLIP